MNVYERKSPVLYVILSLITCGIFGLYWIYVISKELYEFNDEQGSPGLDVLFSIITCGIYYIYLNYKWGKKLSGAQARYTGSSSDESIMYLILAFLGLGFITHCIIQSKLNNEIYPHANANRNGNQNSNGNMQ